MSDLLVITGIGVSPYSARGLTQTLTPIAQASQLRRTVNGALVDLSVAGLRKYASTISCTDADAPALNNVWPGAQVTVDCVPELSYLTSGGSAARTIVTGSSRVEGAYTFYRPRLTMRVIAYSIQRDEYGGTTGWQLDLEEV
jgi:hypothetical protein